MQSRTECPKRGVNVRPRYRTRPIKSVKLLAHDCTAETPIDDARLYEDEHKTGAPFWVGNDGTYRDGRSWPGTAFYLHQ